VTEETPGPNPAGSGSFGAAAWRHRIAITRGFVALLLVAIVLQNVEPTKIDLLFWTLPAVPKLVMILASMAVGAVSWELVRRALGSAREG